MTQRSAQAVDYWDEIWHYQVKQWRCDGDSLYLAIVTNGCTDNIQQAFNLMNAEQRPTHIYDCRRDEIVASNYG